MLTAVGTAQKPADFNPTALMTLFLKHRQYATDSEKHTEAFTPCRIDGGGVPWDAIPPETPDKTSGKAHFKISAPLTHPPPPPLTHTRNGKRGEERRGRIEEKNMDKGFP
ncbi:unnamed protein product [Pleuronectes platessa]|uniref:Uncharacterized protein n=1 Tax=Pleuronectes platessa TaxID=8262 RepID=A0A9N7U7D8_PLEPL|nr:unnamed protein product [Pleuronectes platessa]